MKTSIRAGLALFAFLVLGSSLAFGAPPGPTGAALGEAKLYSSASANAKSVATLSAGDSFRVLETGAREETVAGRKGRWLRISTPEGIQGWLHGGWAVVSTAYLKLADFPDPTSYGRYIAWAFQKGERVRASQEFELVARGDLGWFHSMDDGDPPILVVWDKDLDATPWVEALPKDFPRILSGRVYFVYPDALEPVGEKTSADFANLAEKWRTSASYETLFPIGSRVILGEHAVVVKGDPDSKNWGEEMADFVGLEAIVTGHEEQDPYGRPILTVDIDDGQFYWRAENLELLERGTGEVSDSGGEDYGDGDYSYEDYDEADYALEEAFPVGSLVILGKHLQLDPGDEESAYWAPEMDDYVGMEAYITEHAGLCPWGEPMALVDVDDGNFYWRLVDMELIEKGPGYWEGGEAYDDEYEGEYEAFGEDQAGMVGVGTKVVLGRHDERNGSDNWTEDMDPFVGKQATVTEIIGSDDQGFLVVAVKENTWSWRIRNLAVVGRGVPGSYGFQVGDRVVLGRHRFVDDNENWNPSMDAFVGMSARITELVGSKGDGSDCFLVRVDADKGKWVWRVESLTPVK